MGKWASAAQERWANSASGKKKLGVSEVSKRNKASKGAHLPEKKKPRRR